jgi:hypothetical protein
MPFLSLFLLPVPGLGAACRAGIQWCFSTCQWYEESKVDTGSLSGRHILSFRGSFIAVTTGIHQFEFMATPYSWSDCGGCGLPEPQITFDGVSTGRAVTSRTLTNDLVKDFRYAISGDLEENWMYVRCELRVAWPDRTLATVTPTCNCIEDCEQRGCRLLEGRSREPYSCMPSPTPSQSPTSTRSHTPTPTPTAGFSSSNGFLPTAGFAGSSGIKPSCEFLPTWHPTLEFTDGPIPARQRRLLFATWIFVWVL